MIYTTGTIAVNGNTLTGTGTNFKAAGSLIRVGCTLISMTNPVQVFQITAVGSATSLTVTPAASPAIAAGAKYAILLSDSLSVDGLAQDIAETFTMYQRNISGFADVMGGAGDVTITINGVAVTVPGQKSLAKKGANNDITSLAGLTTALSIGQGGTGATTAADARKNLGFTNGVVPVSMGGTGATTAAEARTALALGNAALKNTGLNPGDVQLVQVGRRDSANPVQKTWSCIYEALQSGNLFPDSCVIQILPGPTSSEWGEIGISYGVSNAVYVAKASYSSSQPTGSIVLMTMLHDKNTTIDSNGFIKKASPVVKIFNDGRAEANDESEGVTVKRISVGVYLIEGCIGLNSDAAWGGIGGGFEIPLDRNKQPRVWLDYEVNPDGSVLVKTYHRTHPDAPEFARNLIGVKNDDGSFTETIENGEPVDVPADSFISVRVEMPRDSIWNQQQEKARIRNEESLEQAEQEAKLKAEAEAARLAAEKEEPDAPE